MPHQKLNNPIDVNTHVYVAESKSIQITLEAWKETLTRDCYKFYIG